MTHTTNLQAGDAVCFCHENNSCAHIGVVQAVRVCSKPASGGEIGNDDFFSRCMNDGRDNSVELTWYSFGPKSCRVGFSVEPSKLKLLDRCFAIGETVKHVETQKIGSVVKSSVTAHAGLIGCDQAIFDVDCNELHDVYPWPSYSNENYVIWGGWLGRISDFQMLAIVRFLDGARLLVTDQCLDDFRPVCKSTSSYGADCFEGAWLRGDLLELRASAHQNKSCKSNFFGFPWGNTMDRDGSFAHFEPVSNLREVDIGQKQAKSTANCRTQYLQNSFSIDDFNEDYPPGHPITFLKDLASYSVTKNFLSNLEQLLCIIKRTPIFLTETATHNAPKLSKLQSSVDVTVFVERLAPVMATVNWFASCDNNSSGPPPSVLYGVDLLNLKSVVLHSGSHCSVDDSAYYRLKPDDVLYNFESCGRAEKLLHYWFTDNHEALNLLRVPINSSTSSGSDAIIDNVSQTNSEPKVHSNNTDFKFLVQGVESSKVTPFWAQVNLFSTRCRRNHVIVDPRRRINYTSLMELSSKSSGSTPTISCNIDMDMWNDFVADVCQRTLVSAATDKMEENEVKTNTECLEMPETRTDTETTARANESIDQSVTNTEGDESPLIPTKSKKTKRKMSESQKNFIRKVQMLNRERAKPGCWVPLRIYSTKSVYTIRWQDGILDTDVACDKLELFLGFTDREIFPGHVVSLKYAENCTTALDKSTPIYSADSNGVIEVPHVNDFIRDYGMVLSCHPADRMCLVQWFRVGDCIDGVGPLVPLGKPEEIGLYELSASSHHQMNYADIIRLKAMSDSMHSLYPAGYLEDIHPESGKLVIRWIDGTLSEVYRSECLEAIETDDSDSSDDDDDDDDDDLVISDSDEDDLNSISNMSTESETSRTSVSAEQNRSTKIEEVISDGIATNDGSDDKNNELSYDEVIRPVASKLLMVKENFESATLLFQDRFIFVLWLMRCFVMYLGLSDELLENVYMAMRTALLLNVSSSTNLESTSDTEQINFQTKFAQLSSSPKIKTSVQSNDSLCEGFTDLPGVDEIEAVSAEEMLSFGRTLLLEAYQLHRDFRIKKFYHMSDFRSTTFGRHIPGILRLVESKISITSTSTHTAQRGDSEQALQTDELTNENNQDPDLYTFHLNQLQTNFRQHRRLSKADNVKNNVTIVVSKSMLSQLSYLLQLLHNDVLEQMSQLIDELLAWFGECAPDLLHRTSKSLAEQMNGNLAISTVECGENVNSENVQIEKPLNDQRSDSFVTDGSEAICPTDVVCQSENELVDVIPGKNCIDEDNTEITTDKKYSFDSTMRELKLEHLPVDQKGQFVMQTSAPKEHHFYKTIQRKPPKEFFTAWKRDQCLLSTSIPSGIIIKGFEDRLDLYCLMIVGSSGTPYEHCLFFFDIALPSSYPTTPPQVHYLAFASEKINPNLYLDGRICLSLLGTWGGEGSENWNAESSSLLQLVVSLQSLILNSEPYFNEAGYEDRRGVPSFMSESRLYNEGVIVNNLQAMVSILQKPVALFYNEIIQHCISRSERYVSLLRFWASLDDVEYSRLSASEDTTQPSSSTATNSTHKLPEFSLAPVSKGFQLSVIRHSDLFYSLASSMKRHYTENQ